MYRTPSNTILEVFEEFTRFQSLSLSAQTIWTESLSWKALLLRRRSSTTPFVGSASNPVRSVASGGQETINCPSVNRYTAWVVGQGKVVSVNVGLHREVPWHGRSVTTGILKQPAAGRVALRKLNLDGDGQADSDLAGLRRFLRSLPSPEILRFRQAIPC